METTDKKQKIPNRESVGKEQHTTEEEKATSNNKAWWEQLAGAMPNDKESVKNWYSLLSNPLIIIFGVLILGYWLVTQKRETGTHMNANIDKEKEQLNVEIKRLKKKYKKVKKRMHTPTDNKMTRQRFTLLD